MKIAVCPNAFRGSLSSFEAADAIVQGLMASNLACECVIMPLADGGDDTLEVWRRAVSAELIEETVDNPLGLPLAAQYGLKDKTALIEMARASGIELIAPRHRNPMHTTTYGTGQLIRSAVEHGATEILVGVGGSATVDGGAGCLQALGAKLLNENGISIEHGGGHLHKIATLDATALQELLRDVTIKVLCDVDNPLVGERGAAEVFGPQKGASPPLVRQLVDNLIHFAEIVARDVGVDIAHIPSTGAAGGLSGGLYGVAGAELVSGVQTLISACGYAERLAQGDIDLLITGEGKLDSQTSGGKAPLGIAQIAQQHQIPVIGIAGAVTVEPVELAKWGIVSAFSLLPEITDLDTALQNGRVWLTRTAHMLGNVLAIGR